MRLLLQSENSCQSKDELTMELFKIEQYVEMVLQYLRLGSDSTDFVIRKTASGRYCQRGSQKVFHHLY